MGPDARGELLTVDEVAARLSLNPRTVREYIRSGRLAATRVGKQYRITEAAYASLTAPSGAAADERPDVVQSDVTVVLDLSPLSSRGAERLEALLLPTASVARLQLRLTRDDAGRHLRVVAVGSLPAMIDFLAGINDVVGAL